MARAVVLLMDSFGIGASEDAKRYGDEGADTLGHIVAHCQASQRGPLSLPNLARLGLAKAYQASSGKLLVHAIGEDFQLSGAYGYAVENSLGKDTPSGHWELAGVPVMFEWGYFPNSADCFPDALLEKLIKEAKLPGVLGKKHASGTVIINELGDEHIKTGKPIVYTSGDSVFQIAAHEQYFGLERLYEVCDIARKIVDEYNIGRVIARPFVGEKGDYTRTPNRRDLSTLPPEKTLLDYLKAAGGKVISVGKVADIYAHQGITQSIKAPNNDALFTATLQALETAEDNTLIFTNFVDFDSKYGHRRDIEGYADALEAFDKRLPELEAILQTGDVVVIAADHGCDPSMPGSDHTREHIPVLFFGPTVSPKALGRRASFADVGQTLATHFHLAPLNYGVACDLL